MRGKDLKVSLPTREVAEKEGLLLEAKPLDTFRYTAGHGSRWHHASDWVPAEAIEPKRNRLRPFASIPVSTDS